MNIEGNEAASNEVLAKLDTLGHFVATRSSLQDMSPLYHAKNLNFCAIWKTKVSLEELVRFMEHQKPYWRKLSVRCDYKEQLQEYLKNSPIK